jgi:hypothetical protein
MVFNVKSLGPNSHTRVTYMNMGYIHTPMPLNEEDRRTAEDVPCHATLLSFAHTYDKGALMAVV